ncbi:MAG TPA: GNAT family N-acetyltransferase [Thermoflexales bacterium]|nr:GNAT family N-acetyltransferase [Thermoflexales bacterium]
MNAWRDGRGVADLLELAFKDEPFDEGGRRLLHMLRHYGPFEAAALEGSRSFIWDENGEIMGNASIQQNPTRKNTWVVGNVAVHPAQRNRGIGAALMQAAIQYARQKRARFVALQVVDGNAPATRVYEKLGLSRVGLTTHYRRAGVNAQAVPSEIADTTCLVRPAKPSDAAAIWELTRHNMPDDLTYSEPFDRALYRPGWFWRLDNFMNGSPEHWFLAEEGGAVRGAIRTRVNYDLVEHNMELMLNESAGKAVGIGLTRAALLRLEKFVGQPITAVQSHPHAPSHQALQEMGFKATRALAHMVMKI